MPARNKQAKTTKSWLSPAQEKIGLVSIVSVFLLANGLSACIDMPRAVMMLVPASVVLMGCKVLPKYVFVGVMLACVAYLGSVDLDALVIMVAHHFFFCIVSWQVAASIFEDE